MTAKHEVLKAAPRARVSAELVARKIADDGGNVWGAVQAFGISYAHALQIRGGWRGAGRRADPVPYRSRGYAGGHKVGHSPDALVAMRG